MEKAAYNCKVCGKGGVVSYDPTCPDLHLDAWLPQLSCNRCADFERAWLKRIEDVKTLAHSINPMRKPTPEQNENALMAIRTLMQDGCDSVSSYLGMQRSVDQELLNEATRNPDIAAGGLSFFRKKAFKQANWHRKTEHQHEFEIDRDPTTTT